MRLPLPGRLLAGIAVGDVARVQAVARFDDYHEVFHAPKAGKLVLIEPHSSTP